MTRSATLSINYYWNNFVQMTYVICKNLRCNCLPELQYCVFYLFGRFQNISVGLRSGEFAGAFILLIPEFTKKSLHSLEVCFGSLSWCKTPSVILKCSAIKDISIYISLFIFSWNIFQYQISYRKYIIKKYTWQVFFLPVLKRACSIMKSAQWGFSFKKSNIHIIKQLCL